MKRGTIVLTPFPFTVTIETSILLGELGELSATVLQEMDAKLRYVLELYNQNGTERSPKCQGN
jgi:hypothetical protein